MTYSRSSSGLPNDESRRPSFESTWLKILSCGSSLLVLAALTGCGAKSPGDANANDPPRHQVSVAITDRGCDLPQVTTPAGKTKFTITNQSAIPLEWEILDGVIVVEEVENILPGTKKDFKTTLKAGTYQMLCGKKTVKERSSLIVTAQP
jgi:iron uptake system component EfeO